MKEVFIIYSNLDNDFDSYPVVIDFKLTEEEAIDEVGRLEELHIDANRIIHEVMSPYHGDIMGDDEYPKFHDIPRWKDGLSLKEITNEIMAERNYLKSENKRMNNEYQEKYEKRKNEIKNECIEKLNSLDLGEELKDLVLTEKSYCTYSFYYQKIIKK